MCDDLGRNLTPEGVIPSTGLPLVVLTMCCNDTGRKPVVEVVEEVIAEHPPPASNTFQAGSLLAGRAPVHLAMTAATIGRFPSMQATQQAQTQAAAECSPDDFTQPQVSCLHACA